MTSSPLNIDTDGIPGSKPSSPASKMQPGWIVQEVPSVGWVVKELPAEDTGSQATPQGTPEYRDVRVPADQFNRPDSNHSASDPQPPFLPPGGEAAPLSPMHEPMMLPGGLEAGMPPPSTLGKPRPRSAMPRSQTATDASAQRLAQLRGTISENSPAGVIFRPAHNTSAEEFERTLGPEPSEPAYATTLGASSAASTAPPAKASQAPRAPRLGGNGKPAGFDAFVVFALDADRRNRDNKLRAAAVTRGLESRELNVCQQSFLARAVNNHLSSSDEAHFMAQAAQSSACAVLLLTRKFIEKADSGAFGDSCVAAFTLAKRLPNAIVVALEPELVDPSAWGWNQIFARFSGRAVVDLSMEVTDRGWEDSMDRLAWLLNPQPGFGRNPFGSSSGSGSPPASWPASPSGTFGEGDLAATLKDVHQEPAYHCFVSHNWGKDSKGRDNDARVHSISRHLQSQGIRIFVHDWESHRYNSPDEAMVDGMRRSGVAIVFLTKSYIEKIEAGKIDDDCVAQFNLAKRAPAIIPVIMEPELVKTSKWGWNRVFAHLSGKMTVDLSRGEVSGLPQLLWTPGSQRLHAALDLLELRVRAEAARVLPKEVQDRPPPMIPQIGIAWLFVACFFFASIVHLLATAGRAAVGDWTILLRLLGILAALFWSIGFAVFVFWLVIKARDPPTFDVNFSLAQPLSIVANFLRATCTLVWVITHILELASVSIAVWSYVEYWAAHIFTGSCLACALDATLFSRGAAGSLQSCPPFTIPDLPGYSSLAFTVGGACMSIAVMSSGDAADLELAAGVSFFLGTCCYVAWLVKTPGLISQYFTAAESKEAKRRETPPAPGSFLSAEVALREAAHAAPAPEFAMASAMRPPEGLQGQPTDTYMQGPGQMHEP